MKTLYIQFLLLISSVCLAQVPVIETADGKGGYTKNSEVVLQKLSIDTKITGKLSTHVVTMVFKNNSNRLREGRMTFPLPESVNASGYALDINGKLRHAVPVEKEKAKEVYETIRKRNVDPGVLEKVEGNNFRTTIYPIGANGGERTVQITYNSELKKSGNGYQYFLPLDYASEIPEFTIKTTVFQNAAVPQLEEKPDGSFTFVQNGNVWVAETHKTNYKPGSHLKIYFPQNNESRNILIQKAFGDASYFLANLDISPSERPKKLPGELAVVWDRSLSGTKRDHAKEWALLEAYFKTHKNITVNTYFLNNTFDSGKSFTIHDGNWSSLRSYLAQVTYDGGTDFGSLQPVKGEEVLFFTDGLASFGDLKMNWKQPVYTVSSSNIGNFNQLKFISNTTGGEFLNLNENDPQKEVRKLLFQPLKFLGIENNASVEEVYPTLKQTVTEDFVLTGILKGNKAAVKLKFGYGNEITETRTVNLDSAEQSVKDWEISKFWAQKKLNELEIFEKQNKDKIKSLSRQFGLVSNSMSLMVLENVEDYIRYDIAPPAELKPQFDAMVKNNRAAKDERVKDMLDDAEEMTDKLKAWWAKDYRQKPKRYPEPKSYSSGNDTARVLDIQEVVVTGVSGMQRTNRSSEADVQQQSNIEEVVMTERAAKTVTREAVTSASTTVTSESARQNPQISVRGMSSIASHNAVQALQGRVAGLTIRNSTGNAMADEVVNSGRISVTDIPSDAEYLKFFSGVKNPEMIYQVYLKNRKSYENLPQYYFDVSQLLFRNNDKKAGLKVLSSIADLDIENEELYKLLAYRLKQAGAYDKELLVTRKVLEWRSFDPQSYRDYALALEDNGKYQEALDNLYKVLTQSYTRELADRDQGIEEIIIMEINQLISRYGNQLDLKKISSKIIADLPVNIRVVINWNKDDTDIDLWVTDPNNERCYYSHKETEVGGRLSDDFTRGFGPEQFLLKKAVKGKYKIQTNFFGENQTGIAGPTAIMAEVYIGYATGKQERKIVVFQNQIQDGKRTDDGILIGEFEF
jgi:Ca-activated chloride channel family protein